MSETSFAPLTPLRFLQRSGSVWSDRIATSYNNEERTYADLLDRSERVSAALRARSVNPGDRVAVLLPNLPEFLELHFAIPGCGAVLVPLNTRLSFPEYQYIFDHASVSLIITSPSLLEAASVAASTSQTKPEIVVVGRDSPYEEMAAYRERLPAIVPDENSVFSITYTSGTTGRPKGVVYSHRGCYLHALGVVAESRLDASSTYLWTLPMFHCHGWAYPWAVTAVGARHACLDGVDPAAIWRLLANGGVTHMCAAPTVLTMLLEAREATNLGRPVSVFVGGAPPTPALLERARRIGFRITHLYGLTETYGPFVVCAWKPEWEDLPPADQAALQGRQGVATIVSTPLRVVDSEMRDVPADGQTMGEIVMQGNNVMIGYYRDPEATREAFRGGWFHSGDLAVMHPDGYVQLRDRLKDIVISGGENISTVEVEGVLASHPDVIEAAVIGVPNDYWGEVMKAYVVRRPGSRLTDGELRDFARQRLARYKAPKVVEFVDSLPKTATGKIQKFVLRAANASAPA